MKKIRTYHHKETFTLESGESLPGFDLEYTTWGKINEEKNNIIWVCHALTGSGDPTEWWGGLFGKGRLFDPDGLFVVCVNMLGSCYGSTGPLSVNPTNNQRYYHDFPLFTNRDVIKAFDILRTELGFEKIYTVVGGSMGGQQALEWVCEKPELFETMILLATNASHSPYGIAFNESQRLAIQNDVTWESRIPQAGEEGMKVARSIALLSYRHYDGYLQRQSEDDNEKTDNFKASSYQQYQGIKLARRFNAFSYWYLSKAMDSHNIGRGRGDIRSVLEKIKIPTLVIGIDSDILFPVEEQKFIADCIPQGVFVSISSKYGHDGFLLEFPQISHHIKSFYLSFGYSKR